MYQGGIGIRELTRGLATLPSERPGTYCCKGQGQKTSQRDRPPGGALFLYMQRWCTAQGLFRVSRTVECEARR